jgi:hypothetical protein
MSSQQDFSHGTLTLTGSGTGSMTMWSYGNQAFTDSSPPLKLRQLQKLEGKGVASRPHSKVVGMVVGASGRVLWSAGKNTISLWSCHSEFITPASRSAHVCRMPQAVYSASCGCHLQLQHAISRHRLKALLLGDVMCIDEQPLAFLGASVD